MRVDLRKFLFIGMSEDKNRFFEKAQELGVVDFIDPSESIHHEMPASMQKLAYAIKVLLGLPTMAQEELHHYDLADGIVQKVLDLKHKLDKLEEDERVVKLEVSRVEIFGNFSPEDIRYIEEEGHKKIQFFCAKKGFVDSPELPEEALYVGTDHGLDYFMTVSDGERHFDKMIEMKVEVPVDRLRERLKHLRKEIEDTEERLKSYQKYNDFLHEAMIDKMNKYSLEHAQSSVRYEIYDALFAVQGWVPENKVNELDELTEEFQVHYSEVAVEDSDVVPTCLQNQGAGRIGEDLVHIYDTPSFTDKDPSMWVLVFFSLFFAFIVGDGGYGFIFLAVTLYLTFKIKKVTKAGKRFLKLVTTLSVACIIWGFFTTSFFGITFSPDNPIRKFSVVHWLVVKKVEYHQRQQDETFKDWAKQFPEIANTQSPYIILDKAYTVRDGERNYEMLNKFSDAIMLELALLVGMIHIALSFGRYLGRNWAGFGWILFIIGAYMYFPYYLGTSSMLHFVFNLNEASLGPQGMYVLFAGLGLAVFLSVLQNKLFGLLEVTTLIQVFGDILSYLRLYALGLAGGIVSATVNELAGSIIFVGGILVILIGHTINILLCIMGGIIHGLRLNFLEWYHYCFDGGGKLFSPLRKLEIE